jgi:hypothetical protein
MYEVQDYERNMLRLIAGLVSVTAQEYENVDDIVTGGLLLGRRRADLRGREFQLYEDTPFGLSLFCWWPFKPQYSLANREFLLQNRWKLFEGLGQVLSGEVTQDRIAAIPLMRAVPDKILDLDRDEMFRMLQDIPIWRLLRL